MFSVLRTYLALGRRRDGGGRVGIVQVDHIPAARGLGGKGSIVEGRRVLRRLTVMLRGTHWRWLAVKEEEEGREVVGQREVKQAGGKRAKHTTSISEKTSERLSARDMQAS